MRFQLRSAAKVNLTLDILHRRPDGYHELASVVHTVGIWDEISIEIEKAGEISFSCNRADLSGDDNLCVRAVQGWNLATNASLGANIHLEKRIPTGAGLGGGSGNAAAILLALNRASQNPLSEADLSAIGATLGADVPLFLRGGAVLMEGIGEKLTPLSVLSGHLLVVKPEISFGTPAIYRAWDNSEMESRRDTSKMLETWPSGDLTAVAQRLGNDLERAAALQFAIPGQLIQILGESGALGAQMSGSGSACFGIYATEPAARAASEKVASALAKLVPAPNAQLFVAPLVSRGIEFL